MLVINILFKVNFNLIIKIILIVTNEIITIHLSPIDHCAVSYPS